MQNHVFGEVYQLATWGTQADGRRERVGVGDQGDDSELATLTEWQHVLRHCDRDAEFHRGLELIINGMRTSKQRS